MRPVAYVCLQDAAVRGRIVAALERSGHVVSVQPTGFHLIRAIDNVILGDESQWPAVIVVDAWARGCAGTTIADGLRDLGIRIPVVVVDGSRLRVDERDGRADGSPVDFEWSVRPLVHA